MNERSLRLERRVLVVEDEPMVAEVVERYLRREGYDVRVSHDGDSAVRGYLEFAPDLVILDIMLPGTDGFEVCRRIRAYGETPVIMLTARSEEVDTLVGLGLGADDYIRKPFSPREVVARVAAVLKRAQPRIAGDGETLRYGDLRINPVTRSVENGQCALAVTAREFDLLFHLARHPGQVFTRNQLMSALWDHAYEGESDTITVHMRRLRAKIEVEPSKPRHLRTVWGVGYKFEP